MTNIADHSMNHSKLRSVKSSFNINFQRVRVRRDNTCGNSLALHFLTSVRVTKKYQRIKNRIKN